MIPSNESAAPRGTIRGTAPGRWTMRLPLAWLLLFCLLPLLIVVGISFSTTRMGIPPYEPLIERGGDGGTRLRIDTGNYRLLREDDLYLRALRNSVRIAFVSTLTTLLLGYAMAYGIATSPRRRQPLLLTLVVLPFWTSFLIRTYAWIGILKREGLLNALLENLGVIREPLTILHTELAVHLGITYAYLPFMILPIYSSLERMDRSLVEAAEDLGSRPLRTFWTITFPLSLPGVAAGCFLVFIPAVGEFVIPDLLGGSETLLIGQTIWTEFFTNRDWPVASAAAVALLAILALPFILLYRWRGRDAASNLI